MSPFLGDLALIEAKLDSRLVSFENPTGLRGRGGTTAKGRKGSPNRMIKPGETVSLVDIAGPGQIRHLWMTFRPGPPEAMRALRLEVFYDGARGPSVSVPVLDFFGLPHGRFTTFESALVAVQEARGLNAWYPMPFKRHVTITLSNESDRPIVLYYQADLTLEDDVSGRGYLHATFRRENPTTLKRDFTILEGLEGPGRFLGCVMGIRPTHDGMDWYGEGELKVYLDDDGDLPTLCGTGLEDYVGTGFGMGPHATQLQGVPVHVVAPAKDGVDDQRNAVPDFVSLYRWHLPDPIIFRKRIKVTVQQIGAYIFPKGDEARFERVKGTVELAGNGWVSGTAMGSRGLLAFGIAERTDDYCATAFAYCQRPQPVPRYLTQVAVADVGRLPYEK